MKSEGPCTYDIPLAAGSRDQRGYCPVTSRLPTSFPTNNAQIAHQRNGIFYIIMFLQL